MEGVKSKDDFSSSVRNNATSKTIDGSEEVIAVTRDID